MERDSDSTHGSQDVFKNTSLEEHHREFQLSVVNSSVSEERTDSASTSSCRKNNNLSSNSENLKKEWYLNPEVDNTSRKSSLINGDLPRVHIVPDENAVSRPRHSPVPGMVEQNSNAYRTSTASQESQSTVLQHSSHHQLVEIEDAREACVSIKIKPFVAKSKPCHCSAYLSVFPWKSFFNSLQFFGIFENLLDGAF